MLQELLFVVDENDKPLKPLPRSQVIQEGRWRRTGDVFVVDPTTKQVLCQKRSDTKDERPGLWIASFGGKSAPGELPEETASRELEEELSIKVHPKKLRYFTRVKSAKHHQFEYLFWTIWQGDISSLHYDHNEVAEIAWFPMDAVIKNLNDDPKWYCYEGDLSILKHIKNEIYK